MNRIRVVLFGLLLAVPVMADRPPVGIVEHLGQTIPLDEEVYDEAGNLIQLRSIITKPTILMFVYYRCPGICSPLLTEVTDVANKMDLKLGEEYRIVTLSFDHAERPEMAADKKENYMSELDVRPDPSAWRFLTADSGAIDRITDAAGFYFKRDGREWLHAGVLIMLSPEGKVTRYLYGIKHVPFDVKMGLIEASEGRIGPTIAKVLQLCFTYDPEGKRYAFDVVRVSGVVVLGLVGVFVIVFIVRPRKKEGR